MSLNWVSMLSDHTPLPLEDECTVRTEPECTLTINLPAPQSSNSSKGKGRDTSLVGNGTLYFTTERLIFVSYPKPGSAFESFSVHYTRIPSASFKQPLFAGNSIEFEITPVPDGGLSPGTKGEIRFKDRGLTEAYATLNKNRERALHRKREEMLNGPELPVYTPSSNPATSSSAVPAPSEFPPAYDA